MKIRKKEIIVSELGFFTDDNVSVLIKNLNEILSRVPDEFRDDVMFDQTEDPYDGPTVEFYYYRPETKIEKEMRLIKITRKKKTADNLKYNKEIKELKRLFKKYGNKVMDSVS